MNKKSTICLLALVGCAVAVANAQENSAPGAHSDLIQNPRGGTYNSSVEEVVKLSRSGLEERIVVAYITNSPSRFQLSVDDITALKQDGISSDVITAMMNHDRAASSRTPAKESPNAPVRDRLPPTTVTSGLNWSSGDSSPLGTAQNPILEPPLPSPAPRRGVKIVDQAPPPPVPEVIPLAPGPEYYWIPGHWNWNGTWFWVGGSYVARPWQRAVWFGGYWAMHGRGRIWIAGRWR